MFSVLVVLGWCGVGEVRYRMSWPSGFSLYFSVALFGVCVVLGLNRRVAFHCCGPAFVVWF